MNFEVSVWDGRMSYKYKTNYYSYDSLMNVLKGMYPAGYIWTIEPID